MTLQMYPLWDQKRIIFLYLILSYGPCYCQKEPRVCMVSSPTDELRDLCHVGVVVIYAFYQDVLPAGDHSGPGEILQANEQ